MDEENEFVQIRQCVRPDLSVIESRKTYSDKFEYHKIFFVFSEGIAVRKECNEEGKLIGYRDDRYLACQLVGDDVRIIDEQVGWVSHTIATTAWAEIVADRELLS